MREVAAPAGRWRGRDVAGAVVFHGMRYARAERFAAPQRAARSGDVVDATRRGPAAPQLPSRLEGVMGAPGPYEQSEDCLTVTVTTPDTAGSLPVLVWLHGGAFLSGSGEWDLYDASRLVRETGIVVVSVSYRLGVLGFLRAPGVSAGNLGLLDQIMALEWVRDNIAAFGGDPAQVTVAGQSAGAQSIVAMLGIEATRGLFARAILQSAPLGLSFHSPRRAQKAAAVMLAELSEDPRQAAVCDVRTAQARAARRLAAPAGLNSAPPLLPVHGTDPLPDEAEWRANVMRRAEGLQVLIGTTAEETNAFHGPHPVFAAVRRIPMLGPRVANAASRLIQHNVFDRPAQRFADQLALAGAEVHRFRFRALHSDSPFGACHCIELPLLFGDPGVWRAAPMLRSLTPGEVGGIGARTRWLWGEFVHKGRPADSAWPVHQPGSRYTYALP